MISHLHLSYTGPSHNWSWDRVGHRDHMTPVKRKEIPGFVVYPTPVRKKAIPFKVQDIMGFTYPTLALVLHCSRQKCNNPRLQSLPLNLRHFRASS